MTDFNFDSACTSPCISAPSSPQHFRTSFFFSAPTSPTHISALYGETKVTRDTDDVIDDDTNDFAFEFSGHEMEKSTVTAADELFDGGKIKLKPVVSFESKQKKKEIESIAEANKLGNDDDRGRERNQHDERTNTEKTETESPVSSLISLWNRTWKLKDLLLFRSASERRVNSSTEELNKYVLVKKARQEDLKRVESSSRRRRAEPISAHELHYKMKRDVLKEMKKKTFLPYKRSVLSWHGCYGLDDTISMYMTRPQ